MKLKKSAIAIAALAGVGAARVLIWLNDGIIALLLMSNGEWTAEAAGKAAPWILFALAGGLTLSLTGLLDDNQRYSRSADRQRKDLTVAQSPKQNARRGL